MSWNQRKEFSNQGQLSTYFDFPEHRDLYSTMGYSQPLGKYTMSWNFRGTSIQRSGLGLLERSLSAVSGEAALR